MNQPVIVTVGGVLQPSFSSTFRSADTAVAGLRRNVGGLNTTLSTLTQRANAVAQAFNRAYRSVDLFYTATGTAVAASRASVASNERIIASNAALATSYRNLAAQRRGLSRAAGMPVGAAGGGGGVPPVVAPAVLGGGGHGRGYALASTAKSVGLYMGGAGALGLFGIAHAVKPAEEYQHQLAQMNVAGMTHLEIVRATAAAWQATRNVPTTSISENLAAIRDLRMVFGDTQHAIEHMATVQKMQSVLGGLVGQGSHEEAYTAAKALELKGAIKTPEEFVRQADMMTKAIVASGGKINPADFLGTFKFARAATSGWSDVFSYQILPTLIQEMKAQGGMGGGAGGPGSALMSAYSAIVGGHIPAKSFSEWERMGMLDPASITRNKKGVATGVKPGGIRGTELFQENPYEWVQKVLLPSMERHGINTEKEIKQHLATLFPNRTAQFVMTNLATRRFQFERDQRLINQAQGIQAYDTLLKTDPRMARMALQKQWESLLATIGYTVMPELIRGAQKLIEIMRGAQSFMKDHPEISKSVLMWGTAASAVLSLGGAVLYLGGVVYKTIAGIGALSAGLLQIVGLLPAGASTTAAAAAGGGLGTGVTAAAGGATAARAATGSRFNALTGALVVNQAANVSDSISNAVDMISAETETNNKEKIRKLTELRDQALERSKRGYLSRIWHGNMAPRSLEQFIMGGKTFDESEAERYQKELDIATYRPNAPVGWTPSTTTFGGNLFDQNALRPMGGDRPALDFFKSGRGATADAITAGGGMPAGWDARVSKGYDDSEWATTVAKIDAFTSRNKTMVVTKQGTFHLEFNFNGIVTPETISMLQDGVRKGITAAAPDWTEGAEDNTDLMHDFAGEGE
jgi:hypothetical protein